jgi:hypothetical protein
MIRKGCRGGAESYSSGSFAADVRARRPAAAAPAQSSPNRTVTQTRFARANSTATVSGAITTTAPASQRTTPR